LGREYHMRQAALFSSIALLPLSWGSAPAQENAGPGTMTFFVTSVGSSKGADLGGLEGADRHCQNLAQAAGASGKTWRAYLSIQATGGANAMNARDRIGRGPWQNAKGVVIARTWLTSIVRTISTSKRPLQREATW
jgi:hypothetical protein